MNRLRFIVGTLFGLVGVKALAQSPPFVGKTFGLPVEAVIEYLQKFKKGTHVCGQNNEETWGTTFDDISLVEMDNGPFKGMSVLVINGTMGRTPAGNQNR
jgi:hypothetical protein